MSNNDQRLTHWLDLSVETDAESVESVSELLSRYGYNHGVVIEEPFRQDEDGDNFTLNPERPVVVRTYLPDNPAAVETQQSILEGLWHLGQIGKVGPLEVTRIEEEDWAHTWKDHFDVLRIGRHWVVKPAWRDYLQQPDDRVIVIDPGMAFGTGSHPSTELCMLLMEDEDLIGCTVLDIGAGSGILSIGAMLAGAIRVDAIEIDSYAYSSLCSNIDLNNGQDRIHPVHSALVDFSLPDSGYDIVLANMIASILVSNVDAITSSLARNGVLLASGIINTREEEVVSAFNQAGLAQVKRIQSGDWVALVLTPTKSV